MTDGSNHVMSLAYNSKLQPTQFDISGGIVHQNYDYQNDGRLSFVHNTNDTKFDRSYSYDHAGRLTEAKTGGQARGDATASPYYETFGYDAFSNLTARQSNNWTQDTLFDSSSYSNHRRSGWGYDADGRNTTIGTRTYAFDADGQVASMAGQKWIFNHYINITQTLGYDGDGQKVKEGLAGAPTYYLRSTVLNGAIIEEIDDSGQKKFGYVYTADGEVLAKQVPMGSSSYVVWKNSTPAGTGQYDWNVGAAYGSGVLERVELDPMGADVGIDAPQTSDLGGEEGDIGSNYFAPMADSRSSNFFDLRGGCTGTVLASCKSPMSPNDYAQARARAMLGDRWYDLPGNDNVRERTERLYVRDVYRIFSEANAQEPAKKKPKPKLQPPKPRNPLTPAQRRQAEERRRRDGKKGPMDEGPVGGVPSTGMPPLTPRIDIIDTGGDTPFERSRERILALIQEMVDSDPCNQAFKDARLMSPRERVQNGIKLSARIALRNPAYNSVLGITENARQFFDKSKAPLLTIKPQETTTGVPIIFFGPDAFNYYDLREGSRHEFIHAAGFGRQYGWLYERFGWGHDLDAFPDYEKIINACKPVRR